MNLYRLAWQQEGAIFGSVLPCVTGYVANPEQLQDVGQALVNMGVRHLEMEVCDALGRVQYPVAWDQIAWTAEQAAAM